MWRAAAARGDRGADPDAHRDAPPLGVIRPLTGRRGSERHLDRECADRLWNGNREHWTNVFRVDPAESIIVWAWTRHRVVRARYSGAQVDPANAHLTFIRLRSDDDVAALTGRAGRD